MSNISEELSSNHIIPRNYVSLENSTPTCHKNDSQNTNKITAAGLHSSGFGPLQLSKRASRQEKRRGHIFFSTPPHLLEESARPHVLLDGFSATLQQLHRGACRRHFTQPAPQSETRPAAVQLSRPAAFCPGLGSLQPQPPASFLLLALWL